MLLDKRKFILFGLWDKMMIFLGLKDNIKSMEVVIENLPNHVNNPFDKIVKNYYS